MPKFTKGEWKQQDGEYGWQHINAQGDLPDGEIWHIATVHISVGISREFGEQAESQANSRLIISAPKMYELILDQNFLIQRIVENLDAIKPEEGDVENRKMYDDSREKVQLLFDRANQIIQFVEDKS